MKKSELIKYVSQIFDNTEEILSSHFVIGNEDSYKLPLLVANVVAKLNVTNTDSAIKNADPIVRLFVRESDKWYSERGIKGGVKPIEIKNKSEAAKAAKEAAKNALKEKIAEKVESENK